VEHKSVLECLEYLKRYGAEVTYLPVNTRGEINLDELKSAIRGDTILVSIQAANNETGVLMPIKEIAHFLQERRIVFHTDAVQIAGKIPFYLDEIPLNLASLSGHKIYGPKGAGALIIRKGMKLDALIHGGNQERKRRGGTENVPAIVGFGAACQKIEEDFRDMTNDMTDMKRIEALRNRLEEGIVRGVSGAYVNGLGAARVPNTLNVSFDGLDGEGLLLNLDLKGIAASSGSACSSGLLDPSHVLLAMGVSEKLALSSVRFSLGYQTTEEDIETVIRCLPEIVSDLRRMDRACH
jgi:cysteine desulfurase